MISNIKIIKQNVLFDFEDESPAFINSIRRIMLNEVDCAYLSVDKQSIIPEYLL